MLLLVLIVVLRFRYTRVERRMKSVLERCRPLLASAAAGDFANLPILSHGEAEILLPLWNQLRESVRGDSEASLDTFAQRMGLDSIARESLTSGSARERLLAINTLGYIGGPDCRADLERYCHDDDSVVSLMAARALVRIDSTSVLPTLVPLILERADWAIARLFPILRHADLARLELELNNQRNVASGEKLERLLLIAGVLPQDRTSSWARSALRDAKSEAQIVAALRLISDPRDATIVRPFLRHPAWQVRVRAVSALERIASMDDVPLLAAALTDTEWWVRLRAARALARFPLLSDQDIAQLCNSVEDRYARDALLQMIAEERPT